MSEEIEELEEEIKYYNQLVKEAQIAAEKYKERLIELNDDLEYFKSKQKEENIAQTPAN